MCSFPCCGTCCGLLSFFGIWFLLCMGSMFSSQPMFTDLEIWEHHEDEDASRNCYIAAAIYFVTLLMSGGCIWYDKKRRSRRPAILSAVEALPELGISEPSKQHA